MNISEHATKQPFILATGFAALVHSTWSLGTLFSGEQPAIENINSLIEAIHFVGWILPALLIAFAMDIGQISTSSKIREHGLTWQRGATFMVFAVATYYLQWLYIAHHMPALPIADGVSEFHRGLTIIIRDFAMWLIPLLLPLSTIMYTLSEDSDKQIQKPIELKVSEPVKQLEQLPASNEKPMADEWEALLFAPIEPETYSAVCECGWVKEYDNPASANRGLNMHKHNCPSLLALSNGNGNHQHDHA